MNKRETHIVTGMTRDLSASRFDNKFVVDARNIRITSTKDKATLLTVTNEKGTGRFEVTGSILGTIIGHAVLNHTLVIFTTDHITETDANPIPDHGSKFDRIYRVDFDDTFTSADINIIFQGNLNFYYKNPLETLPYYETDTIKKVYWVDGRNQPRVVDIERTYSSNPDVFNFNRKIGNNHSMTIEKFNTGGQFPAGTIQYCFNYFDKFGQETNIVDISPLYYLCPQEHGLPADGMDVSSFSIKLSGLSSEFEYVRLYSIIRTSENATPIARVVGDYSINEAQSVIIVDNGIVGYTIDASMLLFIGGESVIAGTFTSKSNTLFLGNIKQNIPNVGTLATSSNSDVATVSRHTASACVFDYNGNKRSPVPDLVGDRAVSDPSYYNYPYDNNKSSYDKKQFKAREGYRLGYIAQYNTGQWSEVVWIDDLDETLTPANTMFYTVSGDRRWGPYYKKPGFEGVLPIEAVNALIDNGFIRVAPVVCYPDDVDRKVPFQGLLSGTVYNVLDRNTNSPFVQADWRFRLGYDDNRINGEIQCNTFNAAPNYPVYAATGSQTPKTASEFLNAYGNQFYRDSSILTFHSPDVEFVDDISQGDFTDLQMRIVGISTLSFIKQSGSTNYSNQRPERTLAAYLYTSSKGYGKKSTKRSLNYFTEWRDKLLSNPRRGQYASVESIIKDYYADLAYIGYTDNALEEDTSTQDEIGKIKAVPSNGNTYYDWVTYLWHRNGSLNNQPPLSENAMKYGSIRYAMLERKCISETQYSRTTFFQTPQTIGPTTINVDINQPMLFDSDQLGVTKVSIGNKVSVDYYGNIDKVITPTFENVSSVVCPIGSVSEIASLSEDGYPIDYSFMATIVEQTTARKNYTGSSKSYVSRQSSGNTTPDAQPTQTAAFLYGTEPVHMRYKSTRHVVIGLASDNSDINQIGIPPTSSYPAFWEDNASRNRVDVLDGEFDSFTPDGVGVTKFFDVRNSVFIAELYRDFTLEREAARFGGTSESAIANNVWKRCGDSVKLIKDNTATMYFKEGDTYLGRYDCLKTYPFSPQDQNQIVSIFSTEVESRVNLDARYDKNKGLTDNTFANPSNFDLFNHPGYEQSNQFFTYKAIDYDRYKSLNYPNLVSFTLEKKPGADIDAWTSIPMTSTFDLKGELGEITKLTTFNDNIFSFQNRGVAQILFNERVQIPTSDGQPIEITNGLKYTGYRYLSDQIGMTNKWSLQSTPYGIYFIDDEKNTLYQFGGQEFKDLSGKAGFRTWLEENNSYAVWNPVDNGNFRTWYDKVNADLYFMNSKESLVFSEQIGNFISLMDYGNLPMMVNMNDKFLTTTRDNETNVNTVWEMWGGEYNMFFDKYRPYWLTFISNTDPTVDKVFDNLAWRASEYAICKKSGNPKEYLPMSTFDTLRVWHEHQDTKSISLIDTLGKPSSLKKKFNVFRTLVPRDRLGTYAKVGRDRIRNTHAYIQLSRCAVNTNIMVFNDLDVDFFE